MATKTASKSDSRRGGRQRKAGSAKTATFKSRGVIRPVEAGSAVECSHCGERVKFKAKIRQYQVICNVYVNNEWDRVEHYHDQCYAAADSPYGPPAE